MRCQEINSGRAGARPSSSPAPGLTLLLALALLLTAGSAWSKRIYSYKDEQGVLHYSDRPPTNATGDVSEELVKVDPRKLVFLREEGPDADKRFSLWNGYGGPIEVLMRFDKVSNVVSEPPLPGSRVIPSQQYSLILQVQPIDESRGWTYSWSYQYVPGDPAARPDPDAVYLLPFVEARRLVSLEKLFQAPVAAFRNSRALTRFMDASWPIRAAGLALRRMAAAFKPAPLHVDQGFGGQYSHSEAHSYHAVDIAMDEGTPIRASRAGVVMAVENDFYGAGTNLAKFADRANHIRILHSDGTMAVYAHLALESVIVGIGDRVRAGEQIARSGNTGFSSGPHLHFVIQRNSGGTLVSVPFAFTVDGQRIEPTQGKMLGGQ
ncbi:MAG: peptidoglycan DD-metalloendopeptidase family protein [Lysobacterales bacterium]